MAVVEAPAAPTSTRVRRPGGLAANWHVVASPALVLVLWWLATDGLGIVGDDLLASPVAVADRLVELIQTPFAGETLFGHVAASLQRWGLGVALAIVSGVAIGIAMAVWRNVDWAVTPLFEALRYIPPLAWVPLAILWFGISLRAQALIVFMAAFPPCVINAHRAVQQLDPNLHKAARSLGAGPLREIVSVSFPAGLPTILAGVAIALGNGWMALIGAELVGARSGLGFVILRGQENAAPDTILAAIVVIALIGAAMTGLMALISKRFVRWQPREGERSG